MQEAVQGSVDSFVAYTMALLSGTHIPHSYWTIIIILFELWVLQGWVIQCCMHCY